MIKSRISALFLCYTERMINLSHYQHLTHHPLLAMIAYHNQITDAQLDELLHPQSLSPSQFESFDRLADKLKIAIARNEKIIVCGDYDADGICSTAILVKTLRDAGGQVGFYIPHRVDDGYGLSVAIVVSALEKGYQHFLLVDNGVSAHAALMAIQDGNAKAYILDHHEITTPPVCDEFIHPNFLEVAYRDACGSGLAYQLSERFGHQPYLLSLAALATVADVVDLWGYNRWLVREGLAVLNTYRFEPLVALLDRFEPIDETTVSFQLVPKINAIGRMNEDFSVNDLVKYLLIEDRTTLLTLAERIAEINQKRKVINSTMMAKTSNALSDPHAVIVIDDPDFHEGIVGITAGQLVAQTGKPAIVLAHRDGYYKGSCRAPLGVDLREVLEAALPYVQRYGGHALAAGIEIAADRYETFKTVLYADVSHKTFPVVARPTLPFNAQLFSLETYMSLEKFKPFGQGFEFPPVELSDAWVDKFQALKNGVKWSCSVDGLVIDVLAFRHIPSDAATKTTLRAVGRLSVSTFRGITRFTLMADEVA